MPAANHPSSSAVLQHEHYVSLDANDPLTPLRAQFDLPDNTIYLDGNSLGVLPRTTASRIAHTIQQEWGNDLIKSWNNAGWIDLPQRVGNAIAPLIGAHTDEVICADSTSINLFKVLAAALKIQHRRAPTRHTLLSVQDNFPTDLYMAQGLADLVQGGLHLRMIDAQGDQAHSPDDMIINALNSSVAVLMLTHVNYRTGYMHDMLRITQAAHAVGVLVIWDLAHSAGAVPVDLHACRADFAVGCGYKYLNGGPGAPAFVWVNPGHVDEFEQPLSGWLGHRAPFVFDPQYAPAAGISRYLCGTPPIISMTALECGVHTVRSADEYGGMTAIRHKSVALTQAFIELVERLCPSLTLVSPYDAQHRGSQVSWSHPTHAYAIVQALIARGVIGDFRAPNVLRFGFTPLYTRFVDVYDAAHALAAVLAEKNYEQSQFAQPQKVT